MNCFLRFKPFILIKLSSIHRFDGNGSNVESTEKDFTEDAKKFLRTIKLFESRYGLVTLVEYLLGSVCIFLSILAFF